MGYYKHGLYGTVKIFYVAVIPAIILVYRKLFYGSPYNLDIIGGSKWIQMAFWKAILLLSIFNTLLHFPIKYMLAVYP